MREREREMPNSCSGVARLLSGSCFASVWFSSGAQSNLSQVTAPPQPKREQWVSVAECG